MNRDKLKTYVLLSLFVMSVFLIQRLLIDIPINMLSSYEQGIDNYKNNYIISDVVCPERYLINYSKNNHTILYSSNRYDLWSDSKDILENIFSSKTTDIYQIKKDEFMDYQYKKSITLCFSEEIQSYVLAKMFNQYIPNGIYDKIAKLDNIYIYLGAKPFVVFGNTNIHNYIRIDNIEIDRFTKNISKQIDKIKNNKYIRYYPGDMILATDRNVLAPNSLEAFKKDVFVKDKINISNITSNDEKDKYNLIENFLNKSIDYIRKVVEGNGTVIYMYDKKGLILTEDGVLEYIDTIQQPVLERDLFVSLSTAVNFITSKDRWPDDAYIYSIEEIKTNDGNKGYRVQFSYRINGVPVVLNKKVMDSSNNIIRQPIQIDVFNEYVKSYTEYVRVKDAEESVNLSVKKALAPREVIEKNIYLIKKIYAEQKNIKSEIVGIDDILSSINKITLSYYDSSRNRTYDRLIEVWVINISDTEYVFDMDDGYILNIFEKDEIY